MCIQILIFKGEIGIVPIVYNTISTLCILVILLQMAKSGGFGKQYPYLKRNVLRTCDKKKQHLGIMMHEFVYYLKKLFFQIHLFIDIII